MQCKYCGSENGASVQTTTRIVATSDGKPTTDETVARTICADCTRKTAWLHTSSDPALNPYEPALAAWEAGDFDAN
jgi:streptogramin lyase